MRILRRRKTTLLWITCLGVLVTALITSVQPHIYQSRALLEIQAFNEDFLNLRDIYPTATLSGGAGLYLQTQADLLQQDSLIERVARKFHLERRPEFQPSASFLSKLRQDIRIAPVRNSRILQIVCDSRDARLAADLANTLARTFIEQSIEARQRAARQTYESLRVQLEGLRPTLLRKLPPAAQFVPVAARAPFLATIDANRRLYEEILQKAYDARMASALRQSNIRLIGPAEPAGLPYRPNLPLNLVIGTLGGFVVAIGCVMLQEQNTSALRSPGEAGMYLALPELGAIPRGVEEQLSLSASESVRATVVSILSATHNGGHPRNLVFTSSRPMEGKTTLVSNLGLALAGIGKRVLLIDGDMRRPQLHRIFDQVNGWGLSDVLREWNSIEELPLKVLVRKTTVPNLYLLPGGASADDIPGLLYSGRLTRLFARCREEFDYVLVDAPPCLEFTDAGHMARCADGLVLVVRAGCTERKTAQAAVQRLECDGTRVTGVILNGWDSSRSGRWGNPVL
jgi:receptor protein-tyrosine kinase